MVDNLGHIKAQLIIHNLQTNCHFRIDKISIIAKLHQVLCSCLIDFFVSNFRCDFVFVDKYFIELLNLSWQGMPVQTVFFNTWEGLVNHCFEDVRLNSVISHLAIINFRTCFFFSRSILCFYTLLVIRFNANNCSLIAIRTSLEKNFLLIFKMVIDRSWQSYCIKELHIIIRCIELTI